jgi:glycine C-acetyltransferase
MADEAFGRRVLDLLGSIEREGLTKPERVLATPQGVEVRLHDGTAERRALNFCANNYLGLANDPRVVAAAAESLRTAGAGFASVRFICGSHQLHKTLERRIAGYLGHDDAILFAAAFDANAAVFEPLFEAEDAIVSDSLNHASIIDGVRLCKARRYRYANNDMEDLRGQLERARGEGARTVAIVTDGVFSMDGYIARLDEVAVLAERYGAVLIVDDCHASGVIGARGAGSAAYRGVSGKVDILTGTFGKALGGAMGGFVAARQPIVELLRQRGRPYLFSNALAPPVCAAALEAIDIAGSAEGDALRTRLARNAADFRGRLSAAGFDLLPGEHPIVPVLLGDARLAQDMARELLALGVFVTGFSYPVVPHGQARIRAQLSAAHTPEHIAAAAAAFVEARDRCGGAA